MGTPSEQLDDRPGFWIFVCPGGIRPWMPESKQLSPCFQQLFLQLPVLTLFAILSAYHFGRIAFGHRVRRNQIQSLLLRIRIASVLVLGVFPVFKYLYVFRNQIEYWPIDVLIGSVEMVTFFVHLGSLSNIFIMISIVC